MRPDIRIAAVDANPLYFSDVCIHCKNMEDAFLQTCKAFPDGIPEEIWNGDNDHTQPFQGDNGIVFEKKVKRIAD